MSLCGMGRLRLEPDPKGRVSLKTPRFSVKNSCSISLEFCTKVRAGCRLPSGSGMPEIDAPKTMTLRSFGADVLAVIDLDLPADATPQLLGDARDWCLTLIELLEQYRGVWVDFDPAPDDEIVLRLVERYPDKVRRARERLEEIDRALRAYGFNPEECGFGKPPPH
jgi:hypothetical protein